MQFIIYNIESVQIDVDETATDIKTAMKNYVEEDTVGIPTEIETVVNEVDFDLQSDMRETDEIVHVVNCVCKLYIGTCIRNTAYVKDSITDEDIEKTDEEDI